MPEKPSAPAAAGNRLACLAEICAALLRAVDAGASLNLLRLRQECAARHGLASIPKLIEVIAVVPEAHRARLAPFLRAKPVRSASGVAVVAVMCKPHRCPHIAVTGGVCVYCPGGPDSDFEYSTQAYTGYEPTSMRAVRARYHPQLQTRARLEQLRALGHATDKVEFILMGGTFLSMAADYRAWFVAGLLDALSGHTSSGLAEAVRFSELARAKCVAITIETRPDYCLAPHIDAMLSYGCTRIEIGVQSVYEDVARDTNRGHTVAAVCRSFALAKDAGFKVVTHMMPDLPQMGMERDLAGFGELFENPAFRPDGLKVYPTLVIRGTGLYELWRTGTYRNYAPEALVDLVARALALVPPWTRVYRIQRDIPMPLVTAGVEHGNLRELALARLRDLGLACRDVRTREVGIRDIHQRVRPDRVSLLRRDYAANGGWETFLSYEDAAQDILVALLRLRRCGPPTAGARAELAGGRSREWGAGVGEAGGGGGGGGGGARRAAAEGDEGDAAEDEGEADASDAADAALGWRRTSIVRELHVYGTAVPVHTRDASLFQHQGYGTLLMEEAARIAREEHGSERIAVISGIGTRGYYRRLGYELEGAYMVMEL